MTYFHSCWQNYLLHLQLGRNSANLLSNPMQVLLIDLPELSKVNPDMQVHFLSFESQYCAHPLAAQGCSVVSFSHLLPFFTVRCRVRLGDKSQKGLHSVHDDHSTQNIENQLKNHKGQGTAQYFQMRNVPAKALR